MKKTFCVLPWIHIRTKSDNKVFPCAAWGKSEPFGDLNKSSINEVMTSETFNTLRKNMLEGVATEGCSGCYARDAADKNNGGDVSMRKMFNSQFKDQIDDIIKHTNSDGSLSRPFQLKAMFVQFSNLCNMACRSCNPSHSSLIAQEKNRKKSVIKITDNNPSAFGQFMDRLDQVQFINFAGGETAFIDEHWEILDRLLEINKTDVTIHWNTNLSTINYNGKNLVDYSKKFPKFLIRASLDATHERAELYRHNTSWPVIESNLRLLKQHKALYVVLCTVGATNIWHVPDMHQYLIENSFFPTSNHSIFLGNALYWPEILSATILPLHFKDEVTTKIQNHIAWLHANKINAKFHFWESLIHYMNNENKSYLLPDFVEYNMQLDKKRNQNFFSTFPELAFLQK